MSFLPIVERELRVSARKRSTFWLRLIAALTGLFIGVGCMVMQLVSGGGTAAFGEALFQILSWLALAAVLAAGVFFTSDALSEEKREGTLGLLFLTDLRGYDVVCGKLLVTSLRGCYALLAIVPILGITLLMGGVTGGLFAKVSIALLNALFVSLTAGLFVSCFSRDPQRALAGTVLLLLLLTFGGMLGDKIWADLHKQVFAAHLTYGSPAYTFAMAENDWERSRFWLSLLITQAMGWAFLITASLCAPRTWQDSRAASVKSQGILRRWRFGGTTWHLRLRTRLLNRDVILWLFCRERWRALGLWFMVLLACAGAGWLFVKAERQAWMLWQYLSWMFLLFFYLWAASNACRFLIDARRSGLVELILATPVTDRDIVRGHWRGIMRQFGLPLCILIGLVATAGWLGQSAWKKTFAGLPVATTTISTNSGSFTTVTVSVTVNGATVTNYSSSGTTNAPPGLARNTNLLLETMPIFGAIIGGGVTLANFLAILWFGMWMGMTSRSVNTATAKTILFVHVLPWLCITFISGITVTISLTALTAKAANAGTSIGPQYFFYYPLLSLLFTGVLTLGKDAGFFFWARGKLRRNFRDQAVRGMGEPRIATPPAMPPPTIPAPPVLPAPPVISG